MAETLRAEAGGHQPVGQEVQAPAFAPGGRCAADRGDEVCLGGTIDPARLAPGLLGVVQGRLQAPAHKACPHVGHRHRAAARHLRGIGILLPTAGLRLIHGQKEARSHPLADGSLVGTRHLLDLAALLGAEFNMMLLSRHRLPAYHNVLPGRSTRGQINIHGRFGRFCTDMLTPLETIVAFVEGRCNAAAFEESLQRDADLESFLNATPAPRYARAASTLFHYLLALDYRRPDDLLSAQGALGRFLADKNVPVRPSPQAAEDYRLLLSAQPTGSTWTLLSCKSFWQRHRPTRLRKRARCFCGDGCWSSFAV